jgi:hypothetical protein
MVLWALREWRERSITFAWGPVRPLFAAAVWLISALRATTRCEGACGVESATARLARIARERAGPA